MELAPELLLLIAFFVWMLLGGMGAIYWRTKQGPLTNDLGELTGGLIFSCAGPVTWLIGWYIVGDYWARPRIIIPQRPWFKKVVVPVVQKEKK